MAKFEEIVQAFKDEGLSPMRWSNGPGDQYGAHSHSYHKVLYCVSGSITFTVNDKAIALAPGTRLEIPTGVMHSAVVGPEGVVCMEASTDRAESAFDL